MSQKVLADIRTKAPFWVSEPQVNPNAEEGALPGVDDLPDLPESLFELPDAPEISEEIPSDEAAEEVLDGEAPAELEPGTEEQALEEEDSSFVDPLEAVNDAASEEPESLETEPQTEELEPAVEPVPAKAEAPVEQELQDE